MITEDDCDRLDRARDEAKERQLEREAEHRRRSYHTCERCGIKTVGFIQSKVNRQLVCLDCYKGEPKDAA